MKTLIERTTNWKTITLLMSLSWEVMYFHSERCKSLNEEVEFEVKSDKSDILRGLKFPAQVQF